MHRGDFVYDPVLRALFMFSSQGVRLVLRFSETKPVRSGLLRTRAVLTKPEDLKLMGLLHKTVFLAQRGDGLL